jgi:hypothetical protein
LRAGFTARPFYFPSAEEFYLAVSHKLAQTCSKYALKL